RARPGGQGVARAARHQRFDDRLPVVSRTRSARRRRNGGENGDGQRTENEPAGHAHEDSFAGKPGDPTIGKVIALFAARHRCRVRRISIRSSSSSGGPTAGSWRFGPGADKKGRKVNLERHSVCILGPPFDFIRPLFWPSSPSSHSQRDRTRKSRRIPPPSRTSRESEAERFLGVPKRFCSSRTVETRLRS